MCLNTIKKPLFLLALTAVFLPSAIGFSSQHQAFPNPALEPQEEPGGKILEPQTGKLHDFSEGLSLEDKEAIKQGLLAGNLPDVAVRLMEKHREFPDFEIRLIYNGVESAIDSCWKKATHANEMLKRILLYSIPKCSTKDDFSRCKDSVHRHLMSSLDPGIGRALKWCADEKKYQKELQDFEKNPKGYLLPEAQQQQLKNILKTGDLTGIKTLVESLMYHDSPYKNIAAEAISAELFYRHYPLSWITGSIGTLIEHNREMTLQSFWFTPTEKELAIERVKSAFTDKAFYPILQATAETVKLLQAYQKSDVAQVCRSRKAISKFSFSREKDFYGMVVLVLYLESGGVDLDMRRTLFEFITGKTDNIDGTHFDCDKEPPLKVKNWWGY